MPQNHFAIKHYSSSIAVLVCALLVGCQHRARTDLYVDSMASEIRDLEDQLYFYDHEYRLLEQELETLRRQNQAITDQQEKSHSNSVQPIPQGKAPFDVLPKTPQGASPRKVEEVSPPPSLPSGSNGQEKSGSGMGGESSSTSPPTSKSSQEPLQFPNQNKEELPLPNRLPAFPPANNSSEPQSPGSTDLDFNPGDLIVPTITTGALAPPSIDPKQISVAPDRDLELSLTQVEIPSQLAAGQSTTARISSAVQIVSDKRVVELAFNPALTRAVSFDDDNQDDGLYLVLQPKNEQGQIVTVAAAVSIEVIDPSREDSKAIIGQWSYTAREVEGKIQPIGSKQGIHLTLPWNGPNPKSDKVSVVATYQFENGRKLVARKEIYLNNNTGLKTVWTPRAGRNESMDSSGAGPVVTASASSSTSEAVVHPVQSSGSYAVPESAPSPVSNFK